MTWSGRRDTPWVSPLERLAPGPACSGWSWRCPLNGTQVSVLPSVYSAANSSAGSCSTLRGQALCGCYLLDGALLSVILGGTCTASCEPGCQSGASSGAVALAGCRAVAQRPLVCPAPQDPGCLAWRFTCGARRQFALSQAQHAALAVQRECAADLDFSSCVVGSYIVDRALLEAVQAGNCTKSCSDDLAPPSCPAAASAPAPVRAAGPLVSAGNSHFSAVAYPPQMPSAMPPAATPADAVNRLYGAPAPFDDAQPVPQRAAQTRQTAALSALLGQVLAGAGAP